MQLLIVHIHAFIKVKTSLTDNEHILERKKHQSGIKKFPHQRSERYGFGISRSPTPSISLGGTCGSFFFGIQRVHFFYGFVSALHREKLEHIFHGKQKY